MGATMPPEGKDNLKGQAGLGCKRNALGTKPQHRNRHDKEKSLTTFLDLYILSSRSSISCDSACVVLDAERQCLRVLPKRGKETQRGLARALVQGHYHQPAAP